MIEIVGSIITVVAVSGVLLNNARRRVCFLLWIVSNSLSAAVHMHASPPMWSMAARDVIFLALAIAGWRQWGRQKRPPACGDAAKLPACGLTKGRTNHEQI